MSNILLQYIITFGWAITGAISMGISLSILIKIFSWISPIDEWDEIKKGNMSAAIVMAAVILGAALVIGLTVMP
ncbi:DUF350 domain-containing protein [Candidatus Parcubacteria bacterium]|nr:DUF350 domain-containing protein [Candidatus Parcubacteria bacterium]